MIYERPFLLFVFPCVFLALAMLYAGFRINASPMNLMGQSPYPHLATIVENEGIVELSRAHTHAKGRLPQGKSISIPIYHLDQVFTSRGSQTTVSFPSGYKIQFLKKSQWTLEKGNPEDASSTTYLHLTKGNYKVLKIGKPRQLYFAKGSKIYPPEKLPVTPPRRLVVIHSNNKYSVKRVDKNSESQQEDQELQAKNPETRELIPGILQTLTNSYIDSRIAKNRGQLARCQITSIRKKLPAKGKMVVGITISPLGKMEDIRVSESNLENPALEKCVTQVLSRTTFRPFNGPVIERTYPVQFQ